jgi:hypothetical protein
MREYVANVRPDAVILLLQHIAKDIKHIFSGGFDGSVLNQISTVLENALKEYAPYSLSTGNDTWMQASAHAHTAFIHPRGFKCDNCLGPCFMKMCPIECDYDCIAKNHAARGGGTGRGGGRGRGDSGHGGRSGRIGGRGVGGNCGRGKFGSPAKNETICVVDGSAYAEYTDRG